MQLCTHCPQRPIHPCNSGGAGGGSSKDDDRGGLAWAAEGRLTAELAACLQRLQPRPAPAAHAASPPSAAPGAPLPLPPRASAAPPADAARVRAALAAHVPAGDLAFGEEHDSSEALEVRACALYGAGMRAGMPGDTHARPLCMYRHAPRQLDD